MKATQAALPGEAPATAVDSGDIRQVIETPEDPQARTELIDALKLLVEAQQAGASAEQAASQESLLERVRGVLVGLWDMVTSIDPEQLVFSALLTLGIIVVALIVRRAFAAGMSGPKVHHSM